MSAALSSLITDRTDADLTNDTDKAYISYGDLNRVEGACAYLAGLFGVQITTKTWKMEDFRTEAEMARLLENIRTVRNAFVTKKSTPVTPSAITYTSIYQANDIEQILRDLGDMYDNMVSGYPRLAFKLGTRSLGNRR